MRLHMSQEWMIDVLTDLKKFAQTNGLMALAEQLDDSILVATSEINTAETGQGIHGGYANSNRILSGAVASSHKF